MNEGPLAAAGGGWDGAPGRAAGDDTHEDYQSVIKDLVLVSEHLG